MFGIIFWIVIIIYILYKKNPDIFNSNSSNVLFFTFLKKKQFSNINKIYNNNQLTLYTADNDGENFIFATKSINSFTSNDINLLYENSKKMHIHNAIVITTSYIPITSITYKQIKEYGIEVWDQTKLRSLIADNHTTSVLNTSDTSNDTCKIDDNSFDPIQDGSSAKGLLSIFNNKIEKL